MKKRFFAISLLLLVLLAGCLGGQTGKKSYTLTVSVVNQALNKKPVEGALVNVIGNLQDAGTTDSTGKVTFPGLSGEIEILVEAEWFEPELLQVHLVQDDEREIELTYSPEIGVVKELEDLKAAIEDPEITNIVIAEQLESAELVKLDRPVNFRFYADIIADLKYEFEESEEVCLSGHGKIQGCVNISAPNATVENGVEITDLITLEALAFDTFIEYYHDNSFVIDCPLVTLNLLRGARKVVISANAGDNVLDIGDSLTTLEAHQGVTISGAGHIGNALIESPDIFVDSLDFDYQGTYLPRLIAAEEEEYQVKITVSPEEAGQVTGEGSYLAGTQVTVKAQAFDGYKFTEWTEADNIVSAESLYSFVLEEDRDLVAHFVEYWPSLSGNIYDENGELFLGEVLLFFDHEMRLESTLVTGGAYEFANLTSGVVLLKAKADGYKLFEQEVTLVHRAEQICDVYLEKVDEESTRAIYFECSNLEDAVRAQIHNLTGELIEGELTEADVVWLPVLDANRYNITSLEGIEHLVNLEELDLDLNQISDLKPLAGLTKLTKLWAAYNEIDDLSGLENLEKLKSLILFENQIVDLSPLANLTELTTLILDYNQVTSLNGLENMADLEELTLFGNQITDLRPLADLTKLTKLWAADNQIRDLGGLENLVMLEDLDLDRNQITNLGPLRNLSELEALYLSDNQITNISVLANMAKMRLLFLGGNQISDLSPLADLTNLWTLEVTANRVENVEALVNLIELRNLFLETNQIRDLSSLRNLVNLDFLGLSCNQIEDINALENLEELTRLYLSNNVINDISALADLNKLYILFLGGNEIQDISALENLTMLEVLTLNGNQITDLSPLVANNGLGSGTQISLEDNPFDLSPGSQNKKDIEALEERGVEVHFDQPEEEFEEYLIEGIVYDTRNQGLEDVCVWCRLEDETIGILTDQNGYWSLEIKIGLPYQVIPEKEGWCFDPPIYNLGRQENNLVFVGYPEPYSLEIKTEGLGQVVIEADEQTRDGKYPSGTNVTLTAEAKRGWQFKEWVGDLSGDDNPVGLLMDSSKEITAVFELAGQSNLYGQIEVKHKFIRSYELGSSGKVEVRSSGLAPASKEGEIIVMFADFVDFAEQKQQLKDAGYTVLHSLEPVNAHLVRYDQSLRIATVYKSLSSLPGMISIEPNYVRKSTGIIPNDPSYLMQSWHYDLIRLPEAWEVTRGDRNIRIAVLDTGVDREHPDLRANLDLEHAYDFTKDTATIYDIDGHGTHVAGTIGAVTNNALGVAGVMWDVEILPLKVIDDYGLGSDFTIARALFYAAGQLDNGSGYIPSVQVVNMSLGGPDSSTFMEIVTREIKNAGVVMVAATGNENTAVDYPAAYNDVIGVGAVDLELTNMPRRAWYSNYGEGLDLMAPGGGRFDVYSTTSGGDYAGDAGTSMASPHVAGVVGLMLANGIDQSEIVDILHRTSVSISGAEYDQYYGYGLLNAYWAVHGVEDLRVIAGKRHQDTVQVAEEIVISLKGGQFELPVMAGEYQLIAWIDVNGNGLIDAGDHYAESELHHFSSEEEYRFAGVIKEVGSWQDLDNLEKGIGLIH